MAQSHTCVKGINGARYDRAETLFYLDPPYFGSEDDYGSGMFPRSQFRRMAERLAAIEGQFILSINDHPETRRIFAAFPMVQAELLYSIGEGAPTPARELIITNARGVDLERLFPVCPVVGNKSLGQATQRE